MKGSDLLDKLEHLDPGRVAGAAEPPAEKARRRPDWGSLAAAAACIAAICLPLFLMYLINGITPTIEYGPGAPQSGSTSHQVSAGDSGPDGDGNDDGPTAAYSTQPKPQENVMGYGDKYVWTRYTLDETYCGAYPDGLPAEEYFKYNRQGPGNVYSIRSDYDRGWDFLKNKFSSCPWITSASAAKATQIYVSPSEAMDKYAEGIFSCLPEYLRPLKTVFRCAEDGGSLQLAYVSTASQPYFDAKDDILRESWNISVLICREPLLTENDLLPGRQESNETVVIPTEGGEPITALGGLDTNRVLMCTLPNGMWCRIAGNFNVPYEDMVKLMNSLISDTSVLDGIDEKLKSGELLPTTEDDERSRSLSLDSLSASLDLNYDPLADINPAVYPYIPRPENNDYAPPICTAGADMDGEPGQKSVEMTVRGLNVNYFEDLYGKPLERYRIDRLDSYEGKDESMGELKDITRNMSIVDSHYNFQKLFMTASSSTDRNLDSQPMHYTFHFTWDDYYVTAVFSEDLTADQLWNFFRQLKGEEQPQGDSTLTAPAAKSANSMIGKWSYYISDLDLRS